MKHLLVAFLLLFSITTFAQTYNYTNSTVCKALVLYKQDSQGFYHPTENVTLDKISDADIINRYAYDKKNKELYVETNYANCVVILNDEYAKIYKKSKLVPQLKGKDLENAINNVSANLASRINNLNEKRTRFIQDSIAKVKEDSLRRIREDSIMKEEKKKELALYRQTHRWFVVPIKEKLKCELCENNKFQDSIYVFGIKNDTAYYITIEPKLLDVPYTEIHVAKITPDIKSEPYYIKHLEAFKDSLEKTPIDLEGAKYSNALESKKYVDKLREIAPYGFFNDWDWSSEYSSISFSFTYTNLNKKTIKYIDVYWKVTNDVNDVRKTGHFQGTGPLAEYESASWNWDYSSYYVAGDATRMELTKVIITYTDGSKKVLSKNMIHCD